MKNLPAETLEDQDGSWLWSDELAGAQCRGSVWTWEGPWGYTQNFLLNK